MIGLLEINHYSLFNLYKNDRGIFGLGTKIYFPYLNDVKNYQISGYLSRQVKDNLDFVLKAKLRFLKAPKFARSEEYDSFKNIVRTLF